MVTTSQGSTVAPIVPVTANPQTTTIAPGLPGVLPVLVTMGPSGTTATAASSSIFRSSLLPGVPGTSTIHPLLPLSSITALGSTPSVPGLPASLSGQGTLPPPSVAASSTPVNLLLPTVPGLLTTAPSSTVGQLALNPSFTTSSSFGPPGLSGIPTALAQSTAIAIPSTVNPLLPSSSSSTRTVPPLPGLPGGLSSQGTLATFGNAASSTIVNPLLPIGTTALISGLPGFSSPLPMLTLPGSTPNPATINFLISSSSIPVLGGTSAVSGLPGGSLSPVTQVLSGITVSPITVDPLLPTIPTLTGTTASNHGLPGISPALMPTQTGGSLSPISVSSTLSLSSFSSSSAISLAPGIPRTISGQSTTGLGTFLPISTSGLSSVVSNSATCTTANPLLPTSRTSGFSGLTGQASTSRPSNLPVSHSSTGVTSHLITTTTASVGIGLPYMVTTSRPPALTSSNPGISVLGVSTTRPPTTTTAFALYSLTTSKPTVATLFTTPAVAGLPGSTRPMTTTTPMTSFTSSAVTPKASSTSLKTSAPYCLRSQVEPQ
ncbi:hypothetical protein L596_030723 [Steinernema carpocapsae]|uniref:Uncharacterized protein n=1 Tax=Steinernema carpocapsae TaxID=34508 RepID=A0A4U5LNK0_STECR|nr:hypothetical protein L596_030723 [Steinernema carpocapsae]